MRLMQVRSKSGVRVRFRHVGIEASGLEVLSSPEMP